MAEATPATDTKTTDPAVPANLPAPADQAPASTAAQAADTADKPEHKYYLVLTDTWGSDQADRPAYSKGDVLTDDEVGPHWKWAVQNNVVAPMSAKDGKARLKERMQPGDKNAIGPEDDAQDAEAKAYATIMANQADPKDDLATADRKALLRTRADVARTRAAEDRQNKANLADIASEV